MKYIFFLLVMILIFSGCSDSEKTNPGNVTGKPGDIIIVIEKDIWNQEPGDELRQSLSTLQPGLKKEEHMFKIFNITPSAFGDFFKSNRNIIIAKISDLSEQASFITRNDTWAKPQACIEISAPDIKQLAEIIHNNSNTIVQFFSNEELKRLQNTFKNFQEKEIIQKLTAYNINLIIPKGYVIHSDSTNFTSITSESPGNNQRIFVYAYNYTDSNIFSNENILAKRDSVLKIHCPGTVPGSWMTTEYTSPIVTRKFALNNHTVYEIRGQWKIQNDFMNGPFISLTALDKKRNKVITVEGDVYAPKSDKIDYIRQLEGILYSLKVIE